MSSASRMSKRLGVAGALRRCLGNANLRRTTRSAAASFFEQPDHLGEHVGGRRFHALAPVVLLGSQPGVLALNGDAQNPVIAEIRLEVAHLVSREASLPFSSLLKTSAASAWTSS